MNLPSLDRRRFLLQSATLAAGLAMPRPHAHAGAQRVRHAGAPHGPRRGLNDTSSSPFVKMRSIGLGDMEWTRGFWADRFATCRETMVPHMGRIMEGAEPSQFYRNFEIAAGLVEGRHRGPPWNDGDF